MADAGPDQTALVGDTVALDGTGSTDVDGDPLTFSWSLSSIPPGSSASLSNPTAVMPTFVIDEFGVYVAQLIVDDGTVASLPDTVTITTENSPPVADAGPDQTVFVGDTVQLDGSGSSDVDGDPLTFSWSLSSIPAGSTATPSDPTAVNPTFDIDLPGTYVAQLIVNDGTVASAPDTVVATTTNSPPVADAGADQNVFLGDTVQLDGSGSSDADLDPLTFTWSLTVIPLGSAASLSDSTSATPSFVADVQGLYVAQLIVNDGSADSAPDTLTIDAAALPSLSIDDVDVSEGAAGEMTDAVFQVTLSAPIDRTVEVDFDTTDGTAVASSDYVENTGTLQIAANDTMGTITVVVLGNDDADGDRNFFVNLTAPVNTTLGDSQAVGTILDDDVAGPTITISPDPLALLSFASGTMTVTLSEAAGVGGQVVDLLSSNTAVVTVPANVSIAEGLTSTTFEATAGSEAGSALVTGTASGFTEGTATVDVANRTMSIAILNPLVGAGRDTPARLTLDQPAPAAGLTINLSTADPGIATVPASLSVAGGDSEASFAITGVAAGPTSVTASAAGFDSATESFVVTNNLLNLPTTLNVPLGREVGLPVAIVPNPAPSGGLLVTLTSSNPGAVELVTPTVTIPAGQLAINATVRGISVGTASVTATATGFASDVSQVSTTAALDILEETSASANPSPWASPFA